MKTTSPLRPPSLVPAALAAALLLAGMPAAARAEGESAQKNGVFALGRVEPDGGVIVVGGTSMVNAVNGAIVRNLSVKPGDHVKKGQVLAEIDTLATEQGQVAIAKAEVELARQEAAAAVGAEQDVCSRADVAQRTAARRTNLRRSGVASDEEADVASGDARALSGACSAARLATKAAAAAVDVALAHVQRAEAERDRCYFRAPRDGQVLRILSEEGEMVGAEGLLEMGDTSRMYAIAEVYETDIARVRKGQKATVTSPALDKPIGGVVEIIRLMVRKQDVTGTDPAARKDARIVEVEVLLDRPEAVTTLTNLQVEVLLHP